MKWRNGILQRSTPVIEQKDGDRRSEMPITEACWLSAFLRYGGAMQQQIMAQQQQQYQQVQLSGYAPNMLAQTMGAQMGSAGSGQLGIGIGSAFGIEPPREPKKEIEIPIQQPTGKRKIKLRD